MDSLTQFVLGSAVTAAVIGPVVGPRRAVLIGGVLGTLPDLDVFIRYDDPIDSYIEHRGPSHAFLVHTLVAPVLGELLIRLDRRLGDIRLRTWLAVWLTLVTHAIIDAMTTYGTRLFWPFFDEPVSVSSIFIIDPLYTLPLLVAVMLALFRGIWSAFFRRIFTTALVVSSLYMGWSVVAQQVMARDAAVVFAAAGEDIAVSETQPLPFNTLVWRTIAVTTDGEVLTLAGSLLDPEPAGVIQRFTQGGTLRAMLPDSAAIGKVDHFTSGLYALREQDGVVLLSDLRMGLHPDYVFTFALGRRNGDGIMPEVITRIPSDRRLKDAAWIWQRLTDPTLAPPQ
ncbi:metal-dependent hydrolase [Alphaproteobacteria bacterium HT1-32]|nr:metal-dependent hydrolase [Alphaproteobacteria bacterium HT1-32]